jgi:hypothetical protein
MWRMVGQKWASRNPTSIVGRDYDHSQAERNSGAGFGVWLNSFNCEFFFEVYLNALERECQITLIMHVQ